MRTRARVGLWTAWLLGVGVGSAGLGLPDSVAAQTVSDLGADWSETSNPNGVWSYRHGTAALPHVASWEPGAFTAAQPGWAISGTSVSRIPFWFKSVATPTFPSTDWLPGDVLIHSRDDANGIGTGEGNVAWTSPILGTIDIAGSVWMARDIGRSNQWSVWLNSTLLTSGTVASGDPYSRANPFDLAAGSGGAPVLDNVAVSPGDVVMLRIARTSQYGDFVGVKLTITATPAPSIPSLSGRGAVLLGALLLGVALPRLPRQKNLWVSPDSGSLPSV
jgi:hypothetical protein